MYEALVEKMITVLESVGRVKQVIMSADSKITNWPAVYVNFDGGDASFETTAENMNIIRFRFVVLVGLTKQKDQETINRSILPKTWDAIKEAFDAGWNQGTLEGHRITVKLSDLAEPEVVEMQDGLAMAAEFRGSFKLLSTN